MDITQIPNTYDCRDGQSTPSRLQYIQDSLNLACLDNKIHKYRRVGIDYHNLYCHIKAPSQITKDDPQTGDWAAQWPPGPRKPWLSHGRILITAHWDMVRSGCDNCLDNTASLYNLYQLALKFQANKHRMIQDVVLAWTDAEEECSSYLNGAVEAAIAYDPKYHIDLELTAGGTNIIVDGRGRRVFNSDNLHYHKMPLNNAEMTWMAKSPVFLRSLLGTACVTLVDDGDLAQLKSKEYCNRWAQCHRSTDTFENWLNLPEMDKFTDNMVELVLSIENVSKGTSDAKTVLSNE